jgi:hypothetical protein
MAGRFFALVWIIHRQVRQEREESMRRRSQATDFSFFLRALGALGGQ